MRSILRSNWLRAAAFAVLSCVLCLSASASTVPTAAEPAAAGSGETLYTADYCFSEADFGADGRVQGVFVTGVPEADVAAVRLGSRVICPGDVLPVSALSSLTLHPACEGGRDAVLTYSPICGTRLDPEATLTIRIKSGKNETPKAIAAEFETYKNIANDGQLTGTDAENGPLTFQLVDSPKRGTIKLEENGAFVYTPTKNKVGDDRFTFTVTDDAGNVSKPAEVRIRILKPTESKTFADLTGADGQFEAVWTRETGLCSGREIGGTLCYGADETVTRAEFLVMAMKLGEVPVEEALTVSGFADADAAAAWLQPYLSSAMRRGIAHGEATDEGLVFRPNEPVTAAQAAVILQSIWHLPAAAPVSGEADWTHAAVHALSEAGIALPDGSEPLTRLGAAKLLYQMSQLKK